MIIVIICFHRYCYFNLGFVYFYNGKIVTYVVKKVLVVTPLFGIHHDYNKINKICLIYIYQ